MNFYNTSSHAQVKLNKKEESQGGRGIAEAAAGGSPGWLWLGHRPTGWTCPAGGTVEH